MTVTNTKRGGGEQLKTQYADAGFSMLPEHTNVPEDGGNSVESGISELRDLMLKEDSKYSTHVRTIF